jgi:hypothetical protein
MKILILLCLILLCFGKSEAQVANDVLSFTHDIEKQMEAPDLKPEQKFELLTKLKDLTDEHQPSPDDDEKTAAVIIAFQTYLEMFLLPENLKGEVSCKRVQSSMIIETDPQEEPGCLKDYADFIREAFRVLNAFCPQLKKTEFQTCQKKI